MLDQNKMPLFHALQKYTELAVTPFHTPGHKLGNCIQSDFAELLGRNIFAIDLTEVLGTDDLHEPSGIIKEAQDLAADLYGADHSFFLINGTTCGIHAMILTICGPGDKIIIPRNAHRAVISGVILCGAIPVFVEPVIDYELGIAMGVTEASVKKMLDAHPDSKGVLLVNPTYYGVAADIKRIIELVHRYNLPIIVDEAHGPHLHFSDRLPVAALDVGADISAQSTHKILGALTQSSMLHVRKGRIDIARLKAMLRMMQSSSPNYVLMASLDAARMQMATQGRALLERTILLAEEARARINMIPGLYCFGTEKIGQPGIHDIDPTKVTVHVKGIGLTGSEVEYLLRTKYNVQAELSDLNNVLFLITIGDSKREIDILVKALQDLVLRYRREGQRGYSREAEIVPPPVSVVSPREAFFSATRKVAFSDAAGKICGEIVTIYPPGIPVLCPGEQITKEIIDYCTVLLKSGLRVAGPEDPTLTTIRVIDR